MARNGKNGKSDKPNILVIWGDDIGQSNLSCYSHGVMGYQTPNIDRIAKEGMMFTDSYGEQSCTAGRSSFITGQSVYRTGLSKVGMPAAPQGMLDTIVTIAALLKGQGYVTGQFGKNHLGDLNKHLPTNHGFDEFFGNLYHLNAEEEPEMENYPSEKDFPNFRKNFGPRGVIHSWATDKDDATVMPRWGKVGKQKIEDTGPLTKKRMDTCDDEFAAAAKDFMKRANDDGKPFFVWLNTTHMHLFTHPKPESKGQAGRWQSDYHDTMIDHDKLVGEVLDYLEELGIADDTFVMYSTDNGPHMNSWPDAGMTPFRSEKNTNWEGAFRVPLLVRWPGHVEPGSIANGIVQHHDWLPTFLAMAGQPDIVDKVKKGYKAIGRTYKNHIDGFNLLDYLTGKAEDKSSAALFLLQRRWRRAGDPVRQLENRIHGAACPGDAADMGGAVHATARSQGVQPENGPVRAGRCHVKHLLRLVPAQSLLHLRCSDGRREVCRNVQRFPASATSGNIHHRCRNGENDRGGRRREPLTKDGRRIVPPPSRSRIEDAGTRSGQTSSG